MRRLISTLLGVFLFISTIIGISACEKDNSNYELTVRITINDSIRVQNSTVRVFAPVTDSYIDWFSNTNEDGETHYQFPNKVVVEIIANKGPFKACSFAEVEPGSNVVTIDLKEHGADNNGCSTN